MGTGLAMTVVLGLLAAEPTGTGTATAERVVAPKTQYVDFGVAEVEGELERPAQSYVQLPPRARFQSLVRVRGDFLPELQRSADAL